MEAPYADVCDMEKLFTKFLKDSGVNVECISVLEHEEINTKEIFNSLTEVHFNILLPKMKIGQHAFLRSIHRRHINRVSTKESSTPSSGSSL
jgi:5-formyltetrahydrofolate cyclo-ligase